ncbi:hypothetical protein B0A48_14818 [Cryoendolithus antarcticus]|uniref:Uncharacterized protein n=1 Tax=Cryoendolithus antarcticus TaxID=1507870 RepID=A0A1V8SIJ9_9PEZI|nr:hypothetical protein B0A48_14818 [Cryoendolithus antarcticus]
MAQPDDISLDGTDSLQPASVLRLPPELRIINYDMLFTATLETEVLHRKTCFPLPPIRRTCRELRIDARETWQVRLSAAFKLSKQTPRWVRSREHRDQRYARMAVIGYIDKESNDVLRQLDVAAARREARISHLRLLNEMRGRLQPKQGYRSKAASLAWWKRFAKLQRAE